MIMCAKNSGKYDKNDDNFSDKSDVSATFEFISISIVSTSEIECS